MNEFTKFIAITKIDGARREVSGVVTSEAPDKDGEICDYGTTAPEYRKWSQEFERATCTLQLPGGASLGNVREMHSHSAVGKVTALDFDDAARTIRVTARVVDDDAWRKCEQGVYTGFSQGGRYLKVWNDPDGIHRRYTAEPTEISLVDNPCNPEARFEYVKADGSVELRKFGSSKEELTPEARSHGGEEEREEQELPEVQADQASTATAETAGEEPGDATREQAIKLQADYDALHKVNDELRAELDAANDALTQANAAIEKLLAEPLPAKSKGPAVAVSKAQDTGAAEQEVSPALAKSVKGDARTLKACLAAGTVSGR